MSGPPFRSGFTQLTSRLPATPAVAVTVGGSGLAGCSATSVTSIVTVMVPLSVPSDAVTVTV